MPELLDKISSLQYFQAANNVEYAEAKKKELQSWTDNKLHSLVLDSGQNRIPKWICTKKENWNSDYLWNIGKEAQNWSCNCGIHLKYKRAQAKLVSLLQNLLRKHCLWILKRLKKLLCYQKYLIYEIVQHRFQKQMISWLKFCIIMLCNFNQINILISIPFHSNISFFGSLDT